MKNEEINALLDKYNAGLATESEKAFLESWYNSDGNVKPAALTHAEIENDVSQVYNLLPGNAKLVRKMWPRFIAAASVILCIFAGGYFAMRQPTTPSKIARIDPVNDIAPGGNKAILTLSNGKQITLSDARNGNIARQGQSDIKKTADGEIEYNKSSNGNTATYGDQGYNTIQTPTGGKYTVTLPDGTKAWLDAESSIKFPAAFNGSARRVSTTGQVYFEVAHDASKPFYVSTAGQVVEVLGTHFNISAYNDDPVIKTTLLEGSIKLSEAGAMAYLKPGQQAQIGNGTVNPAIKVVDNVDMDEAIAWKNNQFIFENEDIHSIMRKLGRWYNIEPEYAAGVPAIGFGGTVSRTKNISEVLKVLELTQAVHFKIEGRRVKVMP